MTIIDETPAGGRRGVGTLSQCVTGKLATLEEIVDWQPYDHVGWRLAVPGVGPVAAVVDLDAVEGGTRIRVRWDYQGAPPLDRAAIAGSVQSARPHSGVSPCRRRRAAGHGPNRGRIMITSQTEQTIERDATEIWAYAADIARHPEWMSVTDAVILRGVGSEVGSRGRERLALGPFKWDVEFEVAEAVPGRRIVWRSVSRGPLRPRSVPGSRPRRANLDPRDIRREDSAPRPLAIAWAGDGGRGQGRTGA